MSAPHAKHTTSCWASLQADFWFQAMKEETNPSKMAGLTDAGLRLLMHVKALL